MTIGIILITASLIFYLIIRFLSRSYLRAYRLSPYHHLWIFLIFVGIGIIDYDLSSPEEFEASRYNNGRAIAHVVDYSATNSGSRLIVRLDALTDTTGYSKRIHNVKCQLNVINGYERYERGSIITFSPHLIQIEDLTEKTSAKHVRSLKTRQIIYSQLIVNYLPRIIGLDKTLRDRALDLRDKLVIFIEMSGLNHNTSSFLITALLGDKTYLDSEVRDKFSDAGISHILALSGMHVAIITLMVMLTLFPINFTGKYKLRYWVAILILWGYAFITGLSPSTVRAVIMATVAFIAIIYERRKSAFSSLLIALFFILIFDPDALFDIGLQLGTVCVGSLIAFANYYNVIDHRTNPYLYKIISLVLASIVATGGSWVLVAYYFQTFSPMFLIANLVVVPLLPTYAISAVIFLIFHAIGIDIGFLKQLIDGGYTGLCNFIDFLSASGEGALHIEISVLTVGIWLTGLVALATGIYVKNSPVVRTLGYSLLAISICSIWF